MSKVRVDRLEDLNGDNGVNVADISVATKNSFSRLVPSITVPTVRDNNTPLQLGDSYYNKLDNIDYVYKLSGWSPDDVNSETLAMAEASTKIGTSLPNGTPGTVQEALNALNESVVALNSAKATTVDNYAAMRLIKKGSTNVIFSLGSLVKGDGGFGIFYLDATDTTSVDNGGSIIVTAALERFKLVQSTPHRLSQFSAVCDGVANDTARLQALIDANKGKKVIIDRGTPMIGGVTLIGTSYDHTFISCEGGELKMAPDGGVGSFGGAWIGILVKDCNFVKANVKFNGNQSAMTVREQIFCIASAGSQDFESDFMTFRNIMGDGLYVSQSDWFANSNPTRRMTVGKIYGYNATDSGRNCVSIISAVGVTIGEVTSYKIGGLMNGVWQPGGIDIEPDKGYHVCEDITVGVANITTAGSCGIGILGKPYTNDATGDWNTARITFNNFNLNLTRTNSGGMSVVRWFDVKLNGIVNYPVNVRGKGVVIAAGSRIKADIATSGCTYGFQLGVAIPVKDFDFNFTSNNYSGSGIRASMLTNGTIKGRVGGSPAGSTTFGVECHNEGVVGATQTNVRYSVDAPYDNVAARAFRNDPANPVVYSNTYVSDCSWTGYGSPSVTCDAAIFCSNVYGYTDQPVIPANGTWAINMVVRKRNPDAGTGKILTGWARLTTGNGNVAGTDWAPMYVTTT